jgi:hypothetical protein
MPNVWTHILYGEQLLKQNEVSFNDEEMQLFKLGTQGPDPFFYHNYLPWKKTPVAEVGLKLHYEHCGPVLLDLIKTAKDSNDNKVKAYVLGFVTHHLLDRNTHPYIHYKAGYKGNDHQKLEIIIDTLLMKEYRNIDTWKTPVYKEIDVGKTLYKPITKMLTNVIEKYYPTTANNMPTNYVGQSYNHMKQALKVLFDPLGWKTKVLKDKVSSFTYQKDIIEKDYLNKDKNTWYHPASNEEESRDSFYELYEKAVQEGEQIFPTILSFWNNENSEEAFDRLEKLLANISYDTGKDATLNLENKYSDSILQD